jgi:GPN-loop GTPase
MPIYGQVVVGPPGSGKTTYCVGMQDYLRQLGRTNTWVVNLDPANEVPKSRPNNNGINHAPCIPMHNDLPYDCLLDVCESVINLSSVMKQLNLGPNGGLVYCIEYLEAHADEVVEVLQERIHQELQEEKEEEEEEKDKEDIMGNNVYLLLDLPGQVELYTHGNAIARLLSKLVKTLDLRLVAVQLIDAHYCTEPANFLSAALLGTTTMLKLELPTISVLSKIDLLVNYGPLPFSLDYFTDCQELERLLPFLQQQQQIQQQHEWDQYQEDYDDYRMGDTRSTHSAVDQDSYVDDPDYQRARRMKLSSPFFRKHQRLHKAMAEIVEDFGLINFLSLDISSAESVGRVLAKIDKCNGYIFTFQNNTNPRKKTRRAPNNTEDLFQCAIRSEPSTYDCIADIQERLAMARVKDGDG